MSRRRHSSCLAATFKDLLPVKLYRQVRAIIIKYSSIDIVLVYIDCPAPFEMSATKAEPGMISVYSKWYNPSTAVVDARGALARGDVRLAHDLLWDSSNNGKGNNGWNINSSDRDAFNDVVRNLSPPELSYERISEVLVKKGKKPLYFTQNHVTKITAEVVSLGDKTGSHKMDWQQSYHTGFTSTHSKDSKISASISGGLLGIADGSVC